MCFSVAHKVCQQKTKCMDPSKKMTNALQRCTQGVSKKEQNAWTIRKKLTNALQCCTQSVIKKSKCMDHSQKMANALQCCTQGVRKGGRVRGKEGGTKFARGGRAARGQSVNAASFWVKPVATRFPVRPRYKFKPS